MSSADTTKNPQTFAGSECALLLIDIQNDYFGEEEGSFPLWNTADTLKQTLSAVELAQAHGVHIIHVQHVADPKAGEAPFFRENSKGVQIHDSLLKIAPIEKNHLVVKHYADSFEQTNLHELLQSLKVKCILVGGMMTQNCVTHTAISRTAEANYQVHVLTDITTTVSQMLHLIALHALSTRTSLLSTQQVVEKVIKK